MLWIDIFFMKLPLLLAQSKSVEFNFVIYISSAGRLTFIRCIHPWMPNIHSLELKYACHEKNMVAAFIVLVPKMLAA